MKSGVDLQRAAMAEICSTRDDWSFHVISDPLTRFLRDRRMQTALRMLRVVKLGGNPAHRSGQ
ncbi:hypothetical protein [Streptomyces sp. MMG1533]|uniref:hypothetical protein n=1 Tax=Streptomyces sp. MMG1533 TaxID=1415546 RepID=UPI000A47D463|nr:hypothetical protein [Streptomyces sp. MMG1533]